MAKLINAQKKSAKEPDELLSFSQRAWEYVHEKPTQLAAFAGGAVVLLLLILGGLFLAERAEKKKIEEVARGVGAYLAEGDITRDGEALHQELKGLTEKYGGSAAGGQALFFMAGALVEKGDHQGAAEAYRKVRQEYSSNTTLDTAAALGLAYTLQLAGEDGEALATFKEILEADSIPIPRTQIRLELGRIYEKQGNTGDAEAEYRLLIESDADSPRGKEAKRRLQALKGV